MDKLTLTNLIKVARGKIEADLVIKNCQYLDVISGGFISGDLAIYQGIIAGVGSQYDGKKVVDTNGAYVVPGFIDTHVHIESSMLVPRQYQRAVLPHGTTTVIWDPHEIGNVKGKQGIQWALEASENLLLDIFLMLPSCVPSTSLKLDIETSGSCLTAADLAEFKDHPRVLGLAELMNFPGLIHYDDDVLDKIIAFQDKLIDGHSPLLSGNELNAYIAAGIHTDHEPTNLKEAQEKLSKGMHILIREGSCAKDAEVLLPLINNYNSCNIALCSDDRNPLDIMQSGHIDNIINKALAMGLQPQDVFRAASYSAARIYGLKNRGAIAPGYLADFVVLRPINSSWSNGVYIDKVFKKGQFVDLKEDNVSDKPKQNYFAGKNLNLQLTQDLLLAEDLAIKTASENTASTKINVIGVTNGQILTENLTLQLPIADGLVMNDIKQDILKIAVFERHKATGNYSIGFVQGFALKRGAIAMSINHDTHNVITVGADDQTITDAVNMLINIDGGIVVIDGEGHNIALPLNIGGLMSNLPYEEVSKILLQQNELVKKMGTKLDEPFLQLAFLALPVIPKLKITDRGLIDVETMKKINVVSNN